MGSRIRGVAAAAGVTCAVALGACGGGDESNADRYEGAEQEVAQVIDELGAAARQGDVAKICEDLITVDLQRSVRQTAGTSCGQEFEENIVGQEARFQIDSLEVDGSQATAVVTDQEDRRSRIALVKVSGGWRIASIR